MSEAAAALRASVLRAARAPFPVLVEGESGSGKELVARGVHRFGPRRDRRICTVNCAALADDLLEAELFGHARGAFTGAIGERAGLFEEADGGTIFLDEVGELSPRAQAKLLRVLQDGEVRRVGENLPRRVDVRIVAATNRRLDEEVAANRFRADLRFRLDVVRIVVPPLRERASDIPALAAHFWTEAAARVGTSATLTSETLSALARYDWPGNVRELQNVIASLGRTRPTPRPHRSRGAARPHRQRRGSRRDDVRGGAARVRAPIRAGRARPRRRPAGPCRADARRLEAGSRQNDATSADTRGGWLRRASRSGNRSPGGYYRTRLRRLRAATFPGSSRAACSSIVRAVSVCPARQRASACLTTIASSTERSGAARSYQAAARG